MNTTVMRPIVPFAVAVLATCALSCQKNRQPTSPETPTQTATGATTDAVSTTSQDDTHEEKPDMGERDWSEVARGALRERGVAGAGELSFASGPDWLYSSGRTKPFRFMVGVGTGGRPGKSVAKHCVAVDTRDGRVYYREPAGFEAFVRAVEIPDTPEKFAADELLTAWFVFEHGASAKIVRDPATVDEELRPHVEPPKKEVRDDGTVVVTGWTSKMRGQRHERHTIEIAPDGAIEAETRTGEEVAAD